MALKVKETGAYRIGTLISIAGLTPSAWTWNIVEDGKIVTGYEPVVLFVFDCIADDGGLVRTGFTVREKGPHFTLEGSTRKLFTSLSALLAYHHVEGATVTMTRRFFNSGGSSEEITEVVGTIVRIEDESAASKGFAVELRSEVASRKLPRVIVAKGADAVLDDLKIPPESAGLAVPVPLGMFKRYLGPHFAGEGGWGYRLYYALHFRPAVIPCVEIYRDVITSRFAFADYLPTGGLVLGNPADVTKGEDAAFVYIPEDDVYAWMRDQASNAAWDTYNAPWNSTVFTLQVPIKPWVTVPFAPTRVLAYTSAINADNCINGEPYDYATIHSGGSIYLEVPQPKYRGRISQNSVDGGSPGLYAGGDGAAAPCGISVRVVLVAPVNVGAIASGADLKVEVVFPGNDTAIFGLSPATITQPTTPGLGVDGALNLPFRNQSDGTFNGQDDGWGATKFHLYDFTSCPAAASGDPDRPLFDTGSAGMEMPFRIKLSVPSSPAGKEVYVSDVKWCVGAHHNVEAWKPNLGDKQANKITGHGVKRKVRKDWLSLSYGDPAERGEKYGIWVGDTLYFGEVQGAQRELPSLKNVYASKASYADAGGTYTGTVGAILSNPPDQARFLLAAYGGETSFQTATGTFGNFVDARAMMNKWAELSGVGLKFEADFLQLTKETVNNSVIDLTSQAPGLFLCKSRIGAWLAHVWYPDPAGLLAYEQYGAEVNPLHCAKTGGGVALSLGWSDAGAIINDLTINYGWDPGRGKTLWTAKCNANDYNDGQGANWPLSIFGAEPTALCDWSQGGPTGKRFGVRDKEITLHGVRDGRIATAIGACILARNYRKSRTLSMTMDAAYCDMQYGHLFTLNHNAMLALGHAAPSWAGVASWGSVWWRCTHAETQGVDGAIATVIEAEWMPTSIGGEISGFAPEEEEGSL